MPFRSTLGGLAGAVDQLFHAAVLNRPRRRSTEELGPVERIHGLRALVEQLAVDTHVADPSVWFPATKPIGVREIEVRHGAGYDVVDLRFASPHRVVLDTVRERWARYPDNATVPLRWFRGPGEGRPAIVFLHGYLSGTFAVEERMWPIQWLVDRGMDALLFTLPFHGERRRSGGGAPPFPAGDPRFTIEGFRQAIMDIAALASFLRERGAPAVGALGMSLGGYTTALAATLVPLDFAVPFIPLASIADFAEEGGRLIGTASQRREQHELLERTYAAVSPLSRPPLVPPAGRLVIAGKRDRITPPRHARRIAEHFDAPLFLFGGGHLMQVGRSESFRELGRLLGSLGLLSARGERP